MKKNILIILLAFAILGPAQSFAQDGSAINPLQKLREVVNTRKEVKNERQEDLRNKIASTTLNTKARIEEARARMASSTVKKVEDRARKLGLNLEKMIARFQATIEREELIMAKIVSRIEKIKALGGETKDAESKVEEARINIDEAKDALLTLEQMLELLSGSGSEIVEKTSNKESWETAREEAKQVEENLREAHKELQKSVGSLKGMSQLKNASTTQN